MIITEKKDYNKILESLKGHGTVYVIGCGRCATSCATGGEEQVKEIIAKLKHDGKVITGSTVIEAPCDERLVAQFSRKEKTNIDKAEVLLVLGCGAGVQTVSDVIKLPTYPALESLFLGKTKSIGRFYELCAMCGDCALEMTGGICPSARCSKHLLNGPCGGSHKGKCEVDPNIDCAWYLIFERLKELKQFDKIKKYMKPKDYSKVIRPRKVELR
jgi:ferredoxin